MEYLQWFVDLFVHLDQHLEQLAQTLGAWLYLALFVVIFCETGLVVTPFLPGDSLLFAVGAVAALPDSQLSVPLLIALLIVAGVLGDAINYAIGYHLGPKVFRREDSWLLNKNHLLRTQRFYEKHGGKTIIWARFIPIVRTFAPFVAGIGRMKYRRFAFFNVIGAVGWVLIFLLAGYWFGNQEFVRRNFQLVIVAIIVVSLIPLGVEYFAVRRAGKARPATGEPGVSTPGEAASPAKP